MILQIFGDKEGIHKLAIMLNDGCPRALTSSVRPSCPKDLVSHGRIEICQQCWERFLLKHATIMPESAVKCGELFSEKE